jgi:hypothetical protein
MPEKENENNSYSHRLSLFCFVLFCFAFKTQSLHVAQAGLKLEILLLQAPECWDYRCAPPRPVSHIFYNLLFRSMII